MPSWDDFPTAEKATQTSWDLFPAEGTEPFLDISDTLSAAGQAVSGLPRTAPHAFRQLYEGLENPWKRSESYLGSKKAIGEYQAEIEAANKAAEESGDISTMSRGMRDAGQSLGFSAGAMGAGVLASTPSAAIGRTVGALAGPEGVIPGEVAGRVVGGLASGYGAAYRMAGAQFLDDARDELDRRAQEKLGRPLNEQEQEEAYQQLLPLAQAFGHAEAGPEAIGNLAMAGAGKYIFGLGKKTIERLAGGALKKAGAAAGGLATELAGETATGVEQKRIEEQKQGILDGKPVEQAPRSFEDYKQAFTEVAPATLATAGLLSSVPAAVKAGQLAFKKKAAIDTAESLNATAATNPDASLASAAAQEAIEDLKSAPLPVEENESVVSPAVGELGVEEPAIEAIPAVEEAAPDLTGVPEIAQSDALQQTPQEGVVGDAEVVQFAPEQLSTLQPDPVDLERAQADITPENAAQVDLSEPILGIQNADGTITVPDGAHRLVAAQLSGRPLNVRLQPAQTTQPVVEQAQGVKALFPQQQAPQEAIRDISNPAQMTPIEYVESAAYQRDRKPGINWRIPHKLALNQALKRGEPVSVEAVAEHQIELPKGYVQRGDIYIPPTQTTQAAAETQTPESVAVDSGAAGVVQSEPAEGSIPAVESKETSDVQNVKDENAQIPLDERDNDDLITALTQTAKSVFDPVKATEAVQRELKSLSPATRKRLAEHADVKERDLAQFIMDGRDNFVSYGMEDVKPASEKDFEGEAQTLREALETRGKDQRRAALESLVGTREKVETGLVQPNDGIEARNMLHNSGDVPGVLTAFVGTSDEFLANKENEANYPAVYKAVANSPRSEGLFQGGRAYVFTDRVGIKQSDYEAAQELGIPPAVAAVRRVLIHESLVHRGVFGLPKHLQKRIMDWMMQNAAPEGMDALAKSSYQKWQDWRTNPDSLLGLSEEYLAKTVERIATFPKQGPLAKLVEILKDIWRYITGRTDEPSLQNLRDVVKLLQAGATAADAQLLTNAPVMLSGEKASFRDELEAKLAKASSDLRAMNAALPKNDLQPQEAPQTESVVQDAYNRSLIGESSIQVPIQKAFNEAKKINPALTEREFGQQLQALYEDGRAFLIPADVTQGMMDAANKWGVYDASGMPASYMALVEEPKASNLPDDRDAEYMAAVEAGDMEKAQQMVDEAAKAAGYSEKGYHGTNANAYSDSDFTVFHTRGERGASFFSSRPEEAGNYGEKVYNVALSLNNPLIIDAKGKSWVDLIDAEVLSKPTEALEQKRQKFAGEASQMLRTLGIDVDETSPLRPIKTVEDLGASGTDTDALAKFARRYGYDGAVFRNVKDSPTAGMYKNEPQDTFAVFNPSQIKSADPITRDAAGNVIPLSQRFQSASPDIRFSNLASTSDATARAIEATKGAKAAIVAVQTEGQLADSQARQLKEYTAKSHLRENKDAKIDIAIKVMDQLEAAGLSPEEILDVTNSPSFWNALGIERNPDMQQFLMAEALLRTSNAANKATTKAEKDRLNSAVARWAQFWYGTGERQGRGLGSRMHLIKDKRYMAMFLKTNLENVIAKGQQNQTESAVEKPAEVAAAIQKAVNDAPETAAEDVSQSFAERMFELGLSLLPQRVQDWFNEFRTNTEDIAILDELEAQEKITAKQSVARDAAAQARFDKFKQMPAAKRATIKADKVKRNAELADMITDAMAGKDATPEKKKRTRKAVEEAAKKPRKTAKDTILGEDDERALRAIERKIAKAKKATSLMDKETWKKIFSKSKASQEERKQAIKDKVAEELPELSAEDQLKLSDLIDKAWDKQRKKLMKSEMDRIGRTFRMEDKAKEAVKDVDKILQLANQGVFEDADLYTLVAEKYGWRSLTPEEDKRLMEVAEKLQQDIPPWERTKLAAEFESILVDATKVPWAQMADSWWVTSVLSGPRTFFTIGLAFLSGAFETFGNAFSTALTKKNGIETALESIRDYFKSFGAAGAASWNYLKTGDLSWLDPRIANTASMLDPETGVTSKQVVGKFKSSKSAILRTMGRFMDYVQRLLIALDNFNTITTTFGALPLAYEQNRKLYSLENMSSSKNLAAAREFVKNHSFGGVEPTTAEGKARLSAWAQQQAFKQIEDLGKILENALYVGKQASMTLDPSGLGGWIYHAILGLSGSAKRASEKFMKEAKRGMLDPNQQWLVTRPKLALAYMYQFAAYNFLNAFGLKFARYLSSRLNQSISFLPILGYFRLYEKTEGGELHNMQIYRNQAIGVLGTLAGYLILKAIADEPDEEKRGWNIEGNWHSLTPEHKSQLLSDGRREYTIKIGNNVYSYANWPIAPVLSAIGSLSDLMKYSPEKWNEKSVANRLASGAWAASASVLDVSAASQIAEIFGQGMASRDPIEKSMNKAARVLANYGGGFVPRLAKDADLMIDPKINTYKTLWERTIKEIPVARKFEGNALLDIFGKQVSPSRWPQSRELIEQPAEPEYKMLSKINQRNLWLSSPNAENRAVGRGKSRRTLTKPEADRYVKMVGQGYKDFILNSGNRILNMPYDRAKAFILQRTDRIRDAALARAVRES